MGQKSVLLRFVETVDFIDKQYGAPALLPGQLGLHHRLADFLNAGEHRRNRQKLGVETAGDNPRQRGFADARAAPQQHRMRHAAFQRHPQRLALADQVLLAEYVVERLRAHPFGQRGFGRGGKKILHGRQPEKGKTGL